MTIAAVLERKGREVATIDAAATLGDTAVELTRRRIGALLVTRGGQVVGLVSERDLVGCMAAEGCDLLDHKVADVMTTELITVMPETPVLTALAMMTNRRVRHLPVMDGGALAGIVSIGDLVKFRIKRIEAEAEAMRAYIQNA